jgi:two-component system sensor histidine kinase YesM
MFSSLRTRLALASVGISLAVLTLLFIVSYASLGRFLEDSNVATTRHNLRIALDVLDYEIVALRQLMSWVAVSNPVQNFVASPRSSEADERRRSLAAFDVLHSSLYGNSLSSFLHKFVIVDRHGRAIQMGNVPGHWSDGKVAQEAARGGPEFLGPDPYFYSTHDTVIGLNKVVSEDFSGEETAWLQVALGTEFLTKALSGYSFDSESRMFFLLGTSVLELKKNRRFEPVALPAVTFQTPDQDSDTGDRVLVNLEGKPRLFVTYQAKGTGWVLAQSVPQAPLGQNSVFLLLAGFVVLAMALLVALLLFLVDRTVNTPVAKIQRRLAAIAGGDFGFEPTIEFRSELGDIGRGINAMSRNIEQLIIRRIQDERARKDLEYRVLESQINPHFLYNTLNSIKWMAEIQKTRGIGEMAGSLAVLLKHLAKGTDEMIPLGQELDLVREYFTIQDYRTGGLAQLKIVVEDPALEAARVLKFTLQPLVENALQHGIEPTGKPGTIVIHAHRNQALLQIDVTDDGVGIPPGKIDDLWEKGDSGTSPSFNPVGLKNVDERIKLRLGTEYGLEVQSERGVFTTVSVRLPFEGGDDVHRADR